MAQIMNSGQNLPARDSNNLRVIKEKLQKTGINY